MDTIFTKIIKGEIPSTKLYEDYRCIVILDINPLEKGHLLVIAKEEKAFIEDFSNHDFMNLMSIAKDFSQSLIKNLPCDATNIIINNGKAAGQEIPHLHIHVIPRYAKTQTIFKPLVKQVYKEGEMAILAKKLELL